MTYFAHSFHGTFQWVHRSKLQNISRFGPYKDCDVGPVTGIATKSPGLQKAKTHRQYDSAGRHKPFLSWLFFSLRAGLVFCACLREKGKFI